MSNFKISLFCFESAGRRQARKRCWAGYVIWCGGRYPYMSSP